jgi:hypothetical protein
MAIFYVQTSKYFYFFSILFSNLKKIDYEFDGYEGGDGSKRRSKNKHQGIKKMAKKTRKIVKRKVDCQVRMFFIMQQRTKEHNA